MIPSCDICNIVFSKVSLFINLIFVGSMYSIKKICSFKISLVGSEIKIISPNFNIISLSLFSLVSIFVSIFVSSFVSSTFISSNSSTSAFVSSAFVSSIIGATSDSSLKIGLLSSMSSFSSSKLIGCDILYLL